MNTRFIPAVGLFLGLALASLGSAQEVPKPDNTGVNQRDLKPGALTADQQKEADADLTKRVRQALVKDKSLSVYGHNVKIIAEAGQVTLRGPVRSEEEKRAIEAAALRVAGEGHVKCELEVSAPEKGNK